VNRSIADTSDLERARASADPVSALSMSQGGLPITASNPASGRRVPSAPKNTSGNSSSQ